MKIIGLSGGIAAGKNFVAEILSEKLKNVAVFDADKENHELLQNDAATLSEVSKDFAKSIVNGKIDRKILAEIVFKDKAQLEILEEIIHKKIRQKYHYFLNEAQKNKIEFVILNIPLLLESQSYRCDYVIAIVTPLHLRKERFLKRENAVIEKFEKIIGKQMSDEERIEQSDFVVDGELSREKISSQIDAIIKELK